MTPDEAIGAGAREAMNLLQEMRDKALTPTPERLLKVLGAVAAGGNYLANMLVAEAAAPGTIRNLDADTRDHLLREARVSAAGALLVYALCPGVDALPSRRDLH